jgi:hypothetical protein
MQILSALQRVGIRSCPGLLNDYDLRTADERDAAPDELPRGVKNIWLNVLADSKQAAPAKIIKLLPNPKEAKVELGDGKAEATFVKSYRDFVSLPSARKAGGDPAIIKAILGVKAEYLNASFDEMKTKYGTIEDYFSKALKIDAAGRKALRDRFLSRADDKEK